MDEQQSRASKPISRIYETITEQQGCLTSPSVYLPPTEQVQALDQEKAHLLQQIYSFLLRRSRKRSLRKRIEQTDDLDQHQLSTTSAVEDVPKI